jgi:hypothetical protein
MLRKSMTRMIANDVVAFALALTMLFSAFIVLLAPRTAMAIPAFARKYQTSCQTCHVAIPALTPFGEAFRQNGYRFPDGQDAEMTKSQPIQLGAEGYKKLWPRALWPGEIPGMPPVAILYTSEMNYTNADKVFTFAGMGGELEILAAGTLDEHFSFWGSVVFVRDGDAIATEMERLNVLVRPFTSPVIQFKVGSFEPGIMLVSTHRSVMTQELLALTQPAGDNAWAPEAFQQGVEAYGMPRHRVLYNAGVVEGSGSVGDRSKDVYGRLAYKWGGMSFDGSATGGAEGVANPKPWSEKSVAISAFAYHGTALLANDLGPAPKDGFNQFGGDVAASWLDLTAHAGYTDRKDDRLFLDSPEITDAKVKNTFAELYWVTYPWLVPGVRFESFKVINDTSQQASFTINGLVRANVKTYLAANWIKGPGGSFINEGATLGLLVGF